MAADAIVQIRGEKPETRREERDLKVEFGVINIAAKEREVKDD